MTEMLKGIAASDGVAVAKAYLLVQPDLSFETVTVEDTSAEEARLDAALAASQDELSVIREKAVESLGEEAAAVFDAHLMVLADPEMTGQIKETIRAKQVNAEAALTEVTDMFIAIFEGMEDNPYMQERAADIRDVTKRVLANLLGKKLPNPATINEESIVVAHDLTPSDTAQLNKKYVKAFVTNIGGRTSHSAIMARTLEIAAVLGTNNITELVKDGDVLAVSGITGEVVINPTEEQIAEFKAAGEAYAKQKAEWALLKDAQTVTADGKHFELAANIGTPKDVEGVNDNGAEAVGLYRTEFLYMDSQDFPTEDDQYEAYKAVLEGMNGKPVVVRTMDIGGDKELPYFDLPKEMNPFLGFRALRISISETGNQMFRTQLRALLRASVHGKLRIMFPMVALLKEFRTAKAILEEEKAKLVAEGVAVADDIQVGIMIEIPAAAMLADQFAKEVDFFSIGTNNITDLVKDGDVLAVSGITGEVVIKPSEEQIAEFKAAGEAYAKQKAEWALLKDAKTVTADGKHFELAANIGTPKDVEGVNENGAEAVGLYRTEFLYMDSQDFPTEDDQYEAYKAVLEGMNGKPVVVRTMDIGGDKELPYFDLPKEMNPFLGYRALRISISETGDAMFRTQIRALLRASVHGQLRIMFPMVALLTEFRKAKAVYDEEKAKLQAEGVAVADNIQVGIMIEIPAAAMLADQFAKEVDFFSIGTNDLIQYTMAADRMNEQVSYLYQPYNPSILRLINNVIKAAHAEGKWAGMCGEMAGDQTAVPLLVGMGLDEFSMSATSVLRTRSLMKKLDTAKMQEYANRALTECSTMEEVLELSKEYVNVD